MGNKVLATITTYCPELHLLEQNIDAIVNQVDKLLVYENASTNRDEIVTLCQNKGVEVILNDKNYGVAGPLHDGLEYAYNNGYEYICTLDQDSVASEGMVESLLASIMSDDKAVIVAAQPVMNVNGEIVKKEGEERYVNEVITSGSLADVAKLMEIGGYMPEMFIDWVDIEICFRALSNGYKIIQTCVPFTHTFGEPQFRKFLWKKCLLGNYSPFRWYHIARNSAFSVKVYKKVLAKRRRGYLLRSKIAILLFEANKWEKLKAMAKGKKDAKAFYKQMVSKYQFLKEKS